MISLVAVVGLSLFMETHSTGSLIVGPDCLRFAHEHDILFSHTFYLAQGQAGYSTVQEMRLNPCTGAEEQGIFELLVQDPPLETYGRFKWGSGAVYAYQEVPFKPGSIQYWYCPANGLERARVILSDTQVCNSFEGTFDFDDGARII
jgi:hypothetical protein